ncbi:hypothetical protein BV20DRAFT_974520 [Pilatotrama ljubarskyi]|nr:hypothetical protein BV20DRAFT_974520 [Pilatotrama ljubarskyi]
MPKKETVTFGTGTAYATITKSGYSKKSNNMTYDIEVYKAEKQRAGQFSRLGVHLRPPSVNQPAANQYAIARGIALLLETQQALTKDVDATEFEE